MGIFNTNTHIGGTDYSFVAREGYEGGFGAQRILAENVINERILFESLIQNDFNEASLYLNESANGQEMEAIMEAATGGFIDKLKAIVKAVIEKIKGLLDKFMVMIANLTIKDNKKFVDKYKQQVLAKDLSKFEYKWRKPKDSEIQKLGEVTKEGLVDEAIRTAYKNAMSLGSADAIDKLITDVNTEDAKIEAYAEIFNVKGSHSSVADVKEALWEKLFEDEDTQEGLDSGLLTYITGVLTESKTVLKKIETYKKKTETAYSKAIAELEKMKKDINKIIPDGGKVNNPATGKEKSVKVNEANKMSKAMNYTSAVVRVANEVVTAYTSELIAITKFEIKNARSVFAKAAAFNPKSVKENAILEAVGEASDFDFDMMAGDVL